MVARLTEHGKPPVRQAAVVGSNFKQTLKILTVILFLVHFIPSFGQRLPQKNGAIEIKKISHRSLKDNVYKSAGKVTNKENRPYSLFYFDTSGNLIEQASYGKHHNTDLRLLDNVIVNKFDKNKIIESIRYETDYSKNISPQTKILYIYNGNDQLIKQTNLDFKTDTLILQFQYEYDSNGNETRSITSPNQFYKKIYDSSSKRISLQQIYDNKVRWEYQYTYTDTTRIGNFKSYYNDGKDYTKQEITTYREGKTIQIQEKYTDSYTYSLIRYYYDKTGLLSKIEYCRGYISDNTLKIESYTEIKAKAKFKLTSQIIEKINDTIIAD